MNITKTGQIIETTKFIELDLSQLHYDKTIYVDNNCYWVKVFHHNNPASNGVFTANASSDWRNGIYESEHKWFDLGIVNTLPKYEFMVKQKLESSSSETKYRWIQNINPFFATYDDVVAANVTKITTSGYSTLAAAGGIYEKNGSAKMCIANANSGNWFGAIGSWTVYQTGFPGYPNTTIKSGYLDLYVRVYINENKQQAQLLKNLATNATTFYEY